MKTIIGGILMSVKKILAALSAAIILCGLIASASCAASFKPGERAADLWYNKLDCAKHGAYLKYKMTVSDDKGVDSPLEIEVTIKKYLSSVTLKDKDGTMTLLTDMENDRTTVISHTDKSFMELEQAEPGSVQMIGNIAEFKKPELSTLEPEAGTEKIDGKTYDVDTVNIGGNVYKYYFDPGTDVWRYWFAGGQMMEILEYKASAESRLFAVPADYKRIEQPKEKSGDKKQ